jgi:hypothetical protein
VASGNGEECMSSVSFEEARAKLSELIHELHPGDEVVITRASGPWREYEMGQVLPGDDPDDPDGDPIIQSNDLKDRGDFAGAQMRYRAWADCNRTKPWRCWKKADLNLLRSQDLLLHFAQPVLAEEELVPDVETRRAERAARHRALGGVEQPLLHAGVCR